MRAWLKNNKKQFRSDNDASDSDSYFDSDSDSDSDSELATLYLPDSEDRVWNRMVLIIFLHLNCFPIIFDYF